MSRYTITPWRTHSDLLAVRQQLYPFHTTQNQSQNQNQNQNQNQDHHQDSPHQDKDNQPDLRALAVSHIMAWKLRGNLPHAIESTALLTDALLHHDLTHNSIFSVRAVYSAAFTRFVTGFCDIGRNRERALEPSSMLAIARQIDMPDEFVALRHEATHEELPSVQRLVSVCEQALEWLWRVYWSRLPEEVVLASSRSADVAKPREIDVGLVREGGRKLLKEFRSARKQGLKAGKGGGGSGATAKSQAELLVKKTAGEVGGLCQDREAAIVALTDTLLDDKMLYPSDRGFGAAMNGAYLLWDGLLQAVSRRQHLFLPTLVTSMHARLNQPSAYHNVLQDPEKEALHLWLLHIASSDVWSQTRRSTDTDVEADLMSLCCLHPSPWSHALGNALLEDGDEAFVDSWSDLLLASAMAGSMEVDAGDGAMGADIGEAQGPEDSMSDNETQPEPAAPPPAWREALKTPKVPVGVV